MLLESGPDVGGQSFEEGIELQQGLGVALLCLHPQPAIEIPQKHLMHVLVGLLPVHQQPAEVLQGTAIAVIGGILPRHQEIRQVEILLEVERNIDGGDREEKPGLVPLHLLHETAVSLHEAKDQLQGEHPSAAEVGLRVLSLEAQTHPFLPRDLRRLLEVLGVQGFDEVPSRLVLEEDVRLLLEGGQTLDLGLLQRIVLAEEALAPVPALEVRLGLAGQEGSLAAHHLNL